MTSPQPKDGRYPGIDLDLRDHSGGWRATKPLYPIAVSLHLPGSTSELFQLREVFMLAVMDTLTDKPGWHTKVFDEAIVAKWRAEALQQPEDGLYRLATEGWRLHNRRYLAEDEEGEDLLPQPRCRILSEKAFDYCIQELRLKAEYFQKTGLVPTLDAVDNCVVKSDVLVNQSLKSEMVAAFAKLRADQASNVDWHPRSNGMVQNLVHPSLYCLVWGKSHFLYDEVVGTVDAVTKWAGKGQPTPDQTENPWIDPVQSYGHRPLAPHFWSAKYQWLPANLKFQDDGTTRFTSYINNLHPVKYEGVYRTIEKLVDQALPAWEQCLNLHDYHRRSEAQPVGRQEPRISPAKYADDNETDGLWEELDSETLAQLDVKLDCDALADIVECLHYDSKIEITDEEWTAIRSLDRGAPEAEFPRSVLDKIPEEDLEEKRWKQVRDPILFEPDDFTQVNYDCEKQLRDRFKESGLQVIVKMASIELTPEKPEFPQGSWHIEGQMNEHICATALYYLDSENVTPSSLAFRMGTDWDQDDISMSAGQDAYHWLERSYGTCFGPSGSGGPCLQFYGRVDTPEGRLLAFPNVFQHRVSSFRLQDPAKPGHRRFVALWLVDPNCRVLSTANVPPQQRDWWADAVFQGDAVSKRGGGGGGGDSGDMPADLLGLLKEEEGLAEKIPEKSPTHSTTGHGGDEKAGVSTNRLPPEILDMVRQNGVVPEGLMSPDEARAHRLQLMDERSRFHTVSKKDWDERGYNFCEH
ncbi:uncharacterized protein PG998_008785 [Apiospora kogelbergensis]|uniref:uncharacterized protein n=1 Tax=Apiospora kogelbergensis TaxID=1337665 RepID=UPI00312D27AA